MSINLNSIRLFLNLYFGPLVFTVAGVVAVNAESKMQSTAVFASLAPILGWVSLGAFAYAAVWATWSAWLLWRATQGLGELCHSCAMPTRYVTPGKYSPHYRCMACGINRRA